MLFDDLNPDEAAELLMIDRWLEDNVVDNDDDSDFFEEGDDSLEFLNDDGSLL